MFNFRDGLRLVGHCKVEVFDRQGRLIDVPIDDHNFIVDKGKELAIKLLSGTEPPAGIGLGHKQIFRMSIGDQGAVPGSPFTPKVPDVTWPAKLALFHEIYRKNITTISNPTPTSARFVTSFLSSDVLAPSFSAVPYIVSEAGLIVSDEDPAKVGIQPPTVPPADETLFSLRTFKSTPFDPLDAVTVTITWTIFIT